MAYEKHTWETGEYITAELLNRVEEGVNLASIPIIKFLITYGATNTVTCESTYEEICNALDKFGRNGAPCLVYIAVASTPTSGELFFGRATNRSTLWNFDYFSIYPGLGQGDTGIKLDCGRISVDSDNVVTDAISKRTKQVSTN